MNVGQSRAPRDRLRQLLPPEKLLLLPLLVQDSPLRKLCDNSAHFRCLIYRADIEQRSRSHRSTRLQTLVDTDNRNMNGQHNSAGPSTPCATSVDAHAQWNQTISVSETEQIQSAGAAPSAAAPQTLFGNYATSPASSTPANISRHLYEVSGIV